LRAHKINKDGPLLLFVISFIVADFCGAYWQDATKVGELNVHRLLLSLFYYSIIIIIMRNFLRLCFFCCWIKVIYHYLRYQSI